METKPKQARSARLRRLALAGVVVPIAVLIPWITMERADAFVPPVPVSIPGSAAGTATSTGTLTLGGSEVVAVGLAGYGAYQGTCYVLGVMYHDPSGCGSGLSNLVHLNFSSSGDSRPAAAGITYQHVGGSPSTTADLQGIVNYSFGSYLQSVGTLITCHNAANTLSATFWYFVYYDSGGTNSAAGACGGSRTGSTPPNDGAGTLLGYPLAAGRSANTICGGTCDLIESMVSYKNLVTSTGALNSARAIADTWYAPDPEPWTLTYTLTCQNSTTTSTETSVVHFTPTASGQSPDPSFAQTCDQLLTGGHVKGVTVDGGRDTGNHEVHIDYPTYNTGATTSYPLCTTKSPPGGCWLDLQKNGKSCFATGVYCAGWMTNETRWNMTCEWGPYSMPMSDCEAAYGDKFDTQTQPDPTTSPTTSPSTGGAPLPTTGPNPGPSDLPSYDPNPTPDPSPYPSGDPQSQSCWGTGWSWNPISWVYVPVKCALSWAFVPKSPPGFGDITNPLPAGWLPTFPSLSDGSCGTITMPSLTIPVIGHTGDQPLLNTCSAPWPLVRTFTYYGLLAGVLIGVGHRGFRAVMTSLGMSVDSGGDE